MALVSRERGTGKRTTNGRGRAIVTSLFLAWSIAILGASQARANPHDWPMYQHDLRRTGYDANETQINRDSVGRLRLKCAFHAGDAITASPVVVNFDDFNGQGPRKVVYVGSADENFYAIDAADCSEIWRFKADRAPALAYQMFVSSAFVDLARGRVYVGGGYTMYALDLSGNTRDSNGNVTPIWKWTTGPDQNAVPHGGGEIETSPLLVDDKVYFGSDLDFTSELDGTGPPVPFAQRYPAVYAVNAGSGALEWYWRPSTIANCGDVWSSVVADEGGGLLYFATADCGTSHQGLYNEAVIALPIVPASGSVDPTSKQRIEPPNWYYQPRDIDPNDYDFGATALLFDRNGVKYLGIGGKDGFYYVIKRQAAVTPNTFRLPEWKTRVVAGGLGDGFIGSSATDGSTIWGATALFDTPGAKPNPPVQPPYLHAFDAATGRIRWQQVATGPSFAATTAVPGVVFIGSIDSTFMAVDADTGQELWAWPAIGAVSSGAAISDGEVFVGAGTKGFGSSEGPIDALYVFAPPAVGPAVGQPPLLPAIWPFHDFLQIPGFTTDGTTPAPTPTP